MGSGPANLVSFLVVAPILSVCVPGVFGLAGRVWIGAFVGSASCIAFLYFQFNSEQGLQSFDFVVFSGAAVWFSVVSAALGWTFVS